MLAERLREVIGGPPMPHKGLDIPVTVSVGVSQVRAETANHEKLLFEADVALYQAKRQGRNRVRAFTPGLS